MKYIAMEREILFESFKNVASLTSQHILCANGWGVILVEGSTITAVAATTAIATTKKSV